MHQALKWIFTAGLMAALPSAAQAGLHDYSGTLGKQSIGLSVASSDSGAFTQSGISSLHYFYVSKLKDIPLKLVSFTGRDIVLEEDDAAGKPVATFKLSFAKQDPQKHFSSKDDLVNEVLVGSWVPASGTPQDVYLSEQGTVSGDGQGGRCDLDAAGYAKLQGRVAHFYTLAMAGNAAAVQKEFKAKLPKNASWKKELSKSVPHDLFCNGQGFMLGRGIVWFNPDGSVISINKF
ncbi:hypothetical protein [Aestuariivirga litoralis]|uniref:hypothetical protein n=1 Tax=Aestuariivirga litoralis TaxID=2650924 RepID=UPI0018C850B0|nr:hypothetical protein [Aestuariivirga litoralis]MBG1233793.1 hypothetical protein [Aestuariivirga litoralis]